MANVNPYDPSGPSTGNASSSPVGTGTTSRSDRGSPRRANRNTTWAVLIAIGVLAAIAIAMAVGNDDDRVNPDAPRDTTTTPAR
jgi:hypothetical protein